MAEEFEFRDLSGAVFWGVNLERATFRDVDLTGVRVSHARLADVVIDAEIERLKKDLVSKDEEIKLFSDELTAKDAEIEAIVSKIESLLG